LDEFAACWADLDDPRTGNAALHDFNELLMIALCSVLSGGQGAVDMGLYARAKEPFLRRFLKLSNGLPSHDVAGAKLVAAWHFLIPPTRAFLIHSGDGGVPCLGWIICDGAEGSGGHAAGQGS
jgi:hypothetical protein